MPAFGRKGGRGAAAWTRAGGSQPAPPPSATPPPSPKGSDPLCEIEPVKPENNKKRKERDAVKASTKKSSGGKASMPKQKKPIKPTSKPTTARKRPPRPTSAEDEDESSDPDTPQPTAEKIEKPPPTTDPRSSKQVPLTDFLAGGGATSPKRFPMGLSPPGPGESTTRVDVGEHRFLRTAYANVQEQMTMLARTLQNLSESYQQVLSEKDATLNEAKRLRQVST